MPVITDQLGRTVTLTGAPQRIVSTVPSQTELLFYLDLGASVIGVTKFCIHPGNEVKHKTKVGGTKQLNLSLIRSLSPDLIIANKEENERGQLEELMADYPVYISDPNDLQSALRMINDIGQLTERVDQATGLVQQIGNGFASLQAKRSGLKAAYLIWRKPYMAAGKNTFIDAMLSQCGWQNAFDETRYPQIEPQDLAEAAPDIVLLSTEPYPFQQKHIAEINTLLPGTPVLLVDGELFSWYGSRLLQSPDYFKTVIDSIYNAISKK